MRMSTTDPERPSADTVDSSCILLENNVSVIELDDSVDENKVLNCETDVPDASILRICFKDAATYNELNSLIARCVKNALFYLQKSVICTEDSSSFTLAFNETTAADNSLFIVDSEPCETPEIASVIPEYSCSEVIINDKIIHQKKDNEVSTPKAAANTCFNCDGNHAIKDCTLPKDLAKIKQNRSKFTSNKISYERYHVDVEQRFGHLNAGELSNDLRSALGLRSSDLPTHIYRMRMLGYPPGWLEHAKVSGSGLTMFDSEGKETQSNENDDEDKYDLKKIISFPGFNVAAPHGTRDESNYYRAPPMQPQHSKACMIEYFRSRSKSTKAYKRKCIQNTEATILEPTDMDIDNGSDDNDVSDLPLGERLAQLEKNNSIPSNVSTKLLNELNPSSSPTSKTPSPLSDGEIIDNEPKREDSPSLDDLNERKKRLLNALDDSTVSITTLVSKPLEDDSLIDDILALQDDSILESSGITDGDTSKISNSSASIISAVNSTVLNKNVLHVSKETVCGTPVIKALSPFSNLPNSEKWREGVSDVLDFQNLPDSIGKYDKMRTIIEKVRVKVKKIQYEDDDDDR